MKFKKEKILFISPHTDDVELGAGGTLIKFIEDGHDIFWIVFCKCSDAVPAGCPPNMLEREFKEVVKSLGLHEENYMVFDYKNRRLSESRQEILDDLVEIRENFRPSLVVIPSLNDYHQDHKTVAIEAIRAFKNHASIIGYELPWNHTIFRATLLVELEERHIEGKISLIKKYKSQFILNRAYFDEEFIRSWARMRGMHIRRKFAEAFEVIRWIL